MFLIIVVFSLLLRPPQPNVAGPDMSQDIQTKLRSQVPVYTLNAEDFAHALITLASRFNLPIGIEWVRSPEALKKVSFSWKNATVREMLEAIVKNQRGYQLDISDGVAHIFPTTMNMNRQDFLNLKIEKFELRNQVVEIASHKLRDFVRLKVSPPQSSSQRPAGIGYSQGANVGDPEFSLKLEDVSVRQILDKLALTSDRKIWTVTFATDAAVTSTGYLRTVTLWNNSDIPDAEQPVWDMFRWSDTIP